ncbi:UNVERIFIED_CONTAM: hypothetical protein Sradi_6253500 [Sesamum radiatum]|uniref:Uncharacterized protein n=1 Tax=Sesamum radiatum TaxID=300843 RepID=A0AAW2KAH3_SESRA
MGTQSGGRSSQILIHCGQCPLLVEPKANMMEEPGNHRGQFCFEAMWLRSMGCEETIRAGWKNNAATEPSNNVWEKIRRCRVVLLQSDRCEFGHVGKSIKELEKQIELRQQGVITDARKQEIKNLETKLEDLHSKEEVFWLQRSKAHSIMERDRNTKFFHALVSSRRRQNVIRRIKNSIGVWRSKVPEV